MIIGELETLVAPAVAALGYELWGCEFASAGKNRRLLRVYIDRAQGVNVDDCAKISRQISAILDVEDPIAGAYLLEVSSPGLERPLFTLAQCRRYLGSKIRVRLRTAVEGQRNFTGTLQSVSEERVILQLDAESSLELDWRNVEKAHLVAEGII